MKKLMLALMLAAGAVGGVAIAQELSPDALAIKAAIESRYDVVPLTDAVALKPKTPRSDVRLIEVSDTVSIDGSPVNGRELRDRLGADAEMILKLSYLAPAERRALFAAPPAPSAPAAPQAPQPPPAPERERERERYPRRTHQSGGERVRIFGDVDVREDEAVAGQVVAVFGSVRIDGEVGDQVVAVLGSVDLGEKAVVHGDVVSVGGHVRRAPGAEIMGGVTEVALGDGDWRVRVAPWAGAVGPLALLGGFGALPRLIGTMLRVVVLLIFVSIAMVVARPWVEGSAQRIADNPLKATLVGLAAELLFVPLLVLTCIVLALTIVGIPLLLLVPFAVLFLLLLALVGFTGAAMTLGQWARRRFRFGAASTFADVWLGVLVIVAPVLLGRLIGLGGFLAGPLAFLLMLAGFGFEFLVWATGIGAVLSNTASRWRARRFVHTPPPAMP